MSFASEFKQFALKGNVVDLAVGVIIGAAFAKIVDATVNDLVMPLAGLVLGNVDFSNLFIALREMPPGLPMTLEAAKKAGIPVLAWGHFVTVALNFAILAFIIFIMVRQINRMRSAAPPPPAAPPENILLLREIRDSLRK